MACGDSGDSADEPGVSGFVFNDRNGNGVRDSGEPGVKGWQLHLCMSDMCSSSATTDGGGRFDFDVVVPGQYQVVVFDAHRGWQRVRTDCSSDVLSLGQEEHKTADMPVRFVGEHVSGFRGSVWKDGAPVPEGTRVQALVGEKVCGETTTCGLREAGYFIWTPSADEEEGCGQDGSEVSFRVDGAAANQTAQWHDQDSATVDLFVGPDLAVFEGPVFVYRPDTQNILAPPGTLVRAYVSNRLCGETTVFSTHPAPNSYEVAVLPEALRAGCGTEGAPISFTIGGDAANERAVWQSGVHDLGLTVGEPPPTPTPTPRATPPPTQRPGKITPTPTASARPSASPTPPP